MVLLQKRSSGSMSSRYFLLAEHRRTPGPLTPARKLCHLVQVEDLCQRLKGALAREQAACAAQLKAKAQELGASFSGRVSRAAAQPMRNHHAFATSAALTPQGKHGRLGVTPPALTSPTQAGTPKQQHGGPETRGSLPVLLSTGHHRARDGLPVVPPTRDYSVSACRAKHPATAGKQRPCHLLDLLDSSDDDS